MNRLLMSVLFFLFFPAIALAQISASPGGISYIPGGSASSPSGGNINGGNACAGYSTVTACALAIGYADPRLNYDTANNSYTPSKCTGSGFDDAAGFQNAPFFTHLPVLDPTNGNAQTGAGGTVKCHWFTAVTVPVDGFSIFRFPQTAVYNDTIDIYSLYTQFGAGISRANMVSTTGTITNASPTVTVASCAGITGGSIQDIYSFPASDIAIGAKVVSCAGTTLTMSANATTGASGIPIFTLSPNSSPYNCVLNIHGHVNINLENGNFRGDGEGSVLNSGPFGGTVFLCDDTNTSTQALPMVNITNTSIRQMGNGMGTSLNITSGLATGGLGGNEIEARIIGSRFNSNGYGIYGNTPDLMVTGHTEFSNGCSDIDFAANTIIEGDRFEFSGNSCYGQSYNYGAIRMGTSFTVGGAVNTIIGNQFQNTFGPAIEMTGYSGSPAVSTTNITGNSFSQDAANSATGLDAEIVFNNVNGTTANTNIVGNTFQKDSTNTFPKYDIGFYGVGDDYVNVSANQMGPQAYVTSAYHFSTETPAHIKSIANGGENDFSVGFNTVYGRTTANSAFDLGALATGLIIPNFTTSSRPSCTSTLYGEIYYDTTTNAPAMCQGASPTWSAIGGSSVSVTAGTPNIVITPSPGTGTFTVGATNPINAQTTTTPYTIVAGDMGKTVTHSKATAVAVTLAQAGTTGFTSGASYTEQNFGVGIVTITPTTSTINGATTLILNTNDGAYIYSDGTNWFALLFKIPTEHISYQPGLLTALNATKAAFTKFTKASTVDNIEGSANTFSCVSNPTITVFECGTSTTCGTPTTIGTVVVTAAGTVVDGTVSSAAITAGDYVAFAQTSGTCASADLAAVVQVHAN